MSLLDAIDSPADLKKLTVYQLESLATELRNFLIHSVHESGGHLSSNLGVVELTVALHYVFNSPQDVFVWDVGHQTYVHKILTGRKKFMRQIRSYGGISGFPKFQESKHDSYNTGHAGTSISQALGEAVARDLKKEEKQVVAIIGDASIATGMALEALNHAGHIRHPFLVILNDNEMSISNNVGALSFSLNRLITTRLYKKWSRFFLRSIEWLPFLGPIIKRILIRFGSNMKSAITELQFFEELGFRYLGPLDGHDILHLTKMLERLKNIDTPTLLHVVTKKGKGYVAAEQNPTAFHGISSSPVVTNEPPKVQDNSTNLYWSLSEFAGQALTFLAKKNSSLCVVTPAMTEGSGLTSFAKQHSAQFFDTGITEQHATAFSGALAKAGLSPFLCIYSTFLQRSYDQLIHDILLMDLPVKILIDRAGGVGNDGETHQGLFDFGYMNILPHIEIFSPVDAQDLLYMIAFMSQNKDKSMAVRFSKRSFLAKDFAKWQENFQKNGETIPQEFIPYHARTLKHGKDILFLCEGSMSENGLQAAKLLHEKGIEVEVVALRSLKPLPHQDIIKAAQNKFAIFTLENHVLDGGVGKAIQNLLFDFLQETGILFDSFAFPNEPIEHGSIKDIEKHYSLDGQNIYKQVEAKLQAHSFFEAVQTG